MKKQLLKTALCLAALTATAASAQTEQTVKTNTGTIKDFVTNIVLNGNNVVLKFEQQPSMTYDMLKTGIDLKYDESLDVKDLQVDRTQQSSAVYDLQGRRLQTSPDGMQLLKKGIYIINGKKRVVR